MSRFPAELTVTLKDGRCVTEVFNQSEMAQFMKENVSECVRKGEPVVVFDGERVEIPAARVASVHVVIRGEVDV